MMRTLTIQNLLLFLFFCLLGSDAETTRRPTDIFRLQQRQEERGCFDTSYSEIPVIPRGGFSILPGGWNPFGYKITSLGEEFLSFDGSLDSDVGRFLASLKNRKTIHALKTAWLEIVRASKAGQMMRIYRKLDDLIKFCLKAGLIN